MPPQLRIRTSHVAFEIGQQKATDGLHQAVASVHAHCCQWALQMRWAFCESL